MMYDHKTSFESAGRQTGIENTPFPTAFPELPGQNEELIQDFAAYSRQQPFQVERAPEVASRQPDPPPLTRPPIPPVMHSRRRPLWLPLVISLIALVVVFGGVLGYTATLSNKGGSASPNTPQLTAQQQAHKVAEQFMTAFKAKDYQKLWSLLHPEIQKQWKNQAAYVAFQQARYNAYTFHSYTLGKEEQRKTWINPETMQSYSNVLHIPVSLKLDLTEPPADTTLLADDVLHPSRIFQNLPLIIQEMTLKGKEKQWRVLAGGPADPEAPVLPPLQPPAQQLEVPILMYHHILELPASASALDLSLAVSPQQFEEQLKYLKQRGYHAITFNQLFNALYFGASLPEHPVILTFDDGYTDAYTNAYTLLKKYGYTGMFYIITEKVGWEGQATWNQLHEMLANGMQIGSHSVHHVDMGVTYLSSPDQAFRELQESRATLEKNLKVPIQQFCYPAGEPFRSGALSTQQAVVAQLNKAGYVGSTIAPGETGIIQDSQQPQKLFRIRVDGRYGLDVFTASIP